MSKHYFNDNYIGGEVEFKDHIGKPYKPNAGDLLIFPSSPDYIHRVLPIESGIKYNAISFAK
jgi:predicted 2-oxoglutarate/Fe(II)-dependent dioxygenase YbiX